mgnify:CR=1 FL=1|jgi:CheY-like chemotaxis protein
MGLHRRILVVDDERSVLLVTHRTLVRLGDGYEVVAAQNGREALDRIREAPFDLVITDLKMPEMDGVALTEAIRELCPDTIVIWMTAYGCGSLMDAAARLMVYGCLEKPVEVAEILRMARKALGSTAGREPAVG